MKIVGTVDIFNRIAQATGFGSSSRIQKPCKGMVQVRNRADGRQIMMVSTRKDIDGHEYEVRNIQTFRTQFMDDGRATIEVSQPPMSIMLRNCNPNELRAFIEGLKQLRGGKTTNSTPKKSLNGGAVTKDTTVDSEKEKPGTLRKSKPLKRARSPELSKSEKAKIKKHLSGIDQVVSVKDRANYPNEFPQTVEQIKITAIRLRKVDERMLRLNNLNYLDLTGNSLKTVDSLVKLKGNLRVLILAKNEIATLPDDFFDTQPLRSLVQLDLSQNMLTNIPTSVVRLFKVLNLNLMGNRIRYLPYNWMDMKNLRILNVGQNQLFFIPATLIYVQLTTLEISDNPNLQNQTDITPDHVGYSIVPTLFERTSEVLMNIQRRKGLEINETLPAIIKIYLRGGKYCMECNKMSLQYKIIKDYIQPRCFPSGACVSSANLVNCLVKKIICLKCDATLPRIRTTRIIF